MRSTPFFLTVLFCTLFYTPAYTARTITGDPEALGTSFSFPIKAYAWDSTHGIFFVGAHQAVAGNAYALCAAGSFDTAFTPLAPEKAMVNNTRDENNPVYGQAIKLLTSAANNPLLVTDNEPRKLLFINSFKNILEPSILISPELTDTLGGPAAEIIAITSTQPDELVPGLPFFAYVYPQGGIFGDAGSGLHILKYSAQSENELTSFSLDVIESVELTRQSPSLTLNNDPLASMTNTICTCWASPLEMASFKSINQSTTLADVLCSGFQIVTGTSGGKAVTFMSHQQSITYDSAITADSIIASTTPNQPISTHFINVMGTSTGLAYLIVVGGLGTPENTKTTVYALPLVNNISEDFGKLASIHAQPTDIFQTTQPYRFMRRVLTTPATTPGDLYNSTDAAAQVGQGTAPYQSLDTYEITGCFVQGDAVIISTLAPDGTAGMYISQALFNNVGLIKGFTPWQPTSGALGSQMCSVNDIKSGAYWLMPGTNPNALQTVQRTDWFSTGLGLKTEAENFFVTTDNGIQGFIDIPQTMTGPALNRACMIATGYKKVQLSFSQTTTGQATLSYTDYLTADNGAIGAIGTEPGINFSGGVLDDMGALVSATVAYNTNNTWLIVAGSGGVAVLAQADGSGSLPTGNATWKKLGSYKNVRKITLGDPQTLFILTDTQLERITCTPELFADNAAYTSTILATTDRLDPNMPQLCDCIISENLALLTTSIGLFYTGAGANALTAATPDAMNWRMMPFNESVGAMTRMYIVNPGLLPYQFYKPDLCGGNIYLLNAGISPHQAHVYRVTITPGAPLTDTTLQKLPDYFVQNFTSFIVNLSNYRNHIFYDGSLFFASRSRYVPTQAAPFLELLQTAPSSGKALVNRNARNVLVPVAANAIGPVVRQSVTGMFIVPTSAGLEIHQ